MYADSISPEIFNCIFCMPARRGTGTSQQHSKQVLRSFRMTANHSNGACTCANVAQIHYALGGLKVVPSSTW